MRKGRPSKYHLKYCKVVLEIMTEGFSKEAVAAELGISRDTLYEWCRRYPDFSDTIKRGELLSQRYWEKIGMDGMLGKIKGFKVAIWIFIMKTRFGWSDNPVQKVTPKRFEVEELSDFDLGEIVRKYSTYPQKKVQISS